SRLLAPILAFTADEAWENIPARETESVHMAEFPAIAEVNEEILGQWERIFAVRDVVLKALEEARNAKLIGSSLEAKVKLKAD
ncbi:class I tRNA ligase family protein, partial [Klebsiella quasipneumoniae]|uniref:class I tRNA ligase family protein n=1 Tax=Klebsiella quasipneumoniae TaxID=1463165 RepID=UPI001BDABB55